MRKCLKFIMLVLISMLMIMSMTACNLFSGLSNVKSLMTPPSLTEDQTELTKALEKHIGKNIMLKYPRSGDNRTAFVECDLDNDGNSEVIAFHMSKDAGAEVKMNIMEKHGEHWEWVCDTTGVLDDNFSRADILSVSFEDMDNDGIKEIITGWYQSTSRNNCLTIFKYNNHQLEHLFSVAYTTSVAVDMDSDGQNELFIANLDYATQTGTASLFKCIDGSFESIGTTEIDGKVTSYAQIKTGKLYKTNTMAVFIDGYKSANEMITEVIYLKDNQLFNPLYSPVDINVMQQVANAETVGNESASGMTMATYRNNALTVCDINADGYYDIPLSVELPAYTDTNAENKTWLTTYFSYDGESAENVFTGIVDMTEGYSFELPDEWLGKVTATSDKSQRSISVIEWTGDSQKQSEDNVMLSLRVFGKEEWESGKYENYYYLTESSDSTMIYAVELGKSDKLKLLNLAEIANRFNPLT